MDGNKPITSPRRPDRGAIHDISGRCEVFLRTQLRPHGFLRLLTRRWAGGCIATLDQDLRRVKTLLEHEASNVPQTDATEPASIVWAPVPDCARFGRRPRRRR
jgi:hypothetical protein